MDWLIAAPGTPTATAREAFAVLIREFWDRHGGPYRILRGTGLEALRHEAEAMGFAVSTAKFREMMMECPAEFLVEPVTDSPQP